MSQSARHPSSRGFEPFDLNELVEIRAHQRTFYGAYARTALGSLGYALTILRLFDQRFHRIGLLFAVLAFGLFCLAFIRAMHSNDIANYIPRPASCSKEGTPPSPSPSPSPSHRRRRLRLRHTHRSNRRGYMNVVKTAGTEGTRVFGRPFVTAGWVVLGVAVVIGAVEVGLLVLIITV